MLPLLPALYIPGLGAGGFAERYLYLPTVGFALLAGMIFPAVARLPERPAVAPAVLGLVLVAAGIATASAHHFLACAHHFSGRLEESVAENELALRLQPDPLRSRTNLAASYFALGKLDQAASAYRNALALRGDSCEAHNGHEARRAHARTLDSH